MPRQRILLAICLLLSVVFCVPDRPRYPPPPFGGRRIALICSCVVRPETGDYHITVLLEDGEFVTTTMQPQDFPTRSPSWQRPRRQRNP